MRKPKTTLASIVKAHRLKSFPKVVVRPNSDHLKKSAPKSVNELT